MIPITELLISEEFTWECLWRNSCDGCMVAQHVRQANLDRDQQEELLGKATVADMLLGSGMTREAVIESLQADPSTASLPVESFEIVVDGVKQWSDKNCRETIRATL
jgi:hypothetical protein